MANLDLVEGKAFSNPKDIVQNPEGHDPLASYRMTPEIKIASNSRTADKEPNSLVFDSPFDPVRSAKPSSVNRPDIASKGEDLPPHTVRLPDYNGGHLENTNGFKIDKKTEDLPPHTVKLPDYNGGRLENTNGFKIEGIKP